MIVEFIYQLLEPYLPDFISDYVVNSFPTCNLKETNFSPLSIVNYEGFGWSTVGCLLERDALLSIQQYCVSLLSDMLLKKVLDAHWPALLACASNVSLTANADATLISKLCGVQCLTSRTGNCIAAFNAEANTLQLTAVFYSGVNNGPCVQPLVDKDSDIICTGPDFELGLAVMVCVWAACLGYGYFQPLFVQLFALIRIMNQN